MRRPSRLLAIALLPSPLLAATPSDALRVVATRSSGVARDAGARVSDAGQEILRRTEGEGATGVARTARFAVIRAAPVREATRNTAQNLQLARMRVAHAEGQQLLARIGQVRAGPAAAATAAVAPPAPAAPAEPWSVTRALGATSQAAPSLTRTALQGAALTKAATMSPAAKQFASPFHPGNVAFAVAATAGFHVLHQLRDPERPLDLGGALGFVKDRAFWGGMVGSAVGYGAVAALTASLIPAGAGITVAMAPMLAGMVASVVGWEMGAAAFQGENPLHALTAMRPGQVLGQAGGTTVGLALGANLGGAVGGATLGAVVGPLGAVAGALLLGTMGSRFGEELFGAADSAMSGDLDAAVSQVRAAEQTMSLLRVGIASDYQSLQHALETGDRLAAMERLDSLQRRTQALAAAREALEATP